MRKCMCECGGAGAEVRGVKGAGCGGVGRGGKGAAAARLTSALAHTVFHC